MSMDHTVYSIFLILHDTIPSLDEIKAYAKIKKVLAQKFPYDIDGYCDGKEEFVRKIEKLALSQFD